MSAFILAAAVVLAPHPPVDAGLASRDALVEASRAGERPVSEAESEARASRIIRGEVASYDRFRGHLYVDDALGGRLLEVDRDTVVLTPGGESSLDALPEGADVRATFDPEGRAEVIQVLPPPRVESPGRPTSLPRINPGAPNPSAPDPRQDRAPGDVPGNRIPRRTGPPQGD